MIRGLGRTVSMAVNLAANGMTPEEISKEYRALEPEGIRQALQDLASPEEELEILSPGIQ